MVMAPSIIYVWNGTALPDWVVMSINLTKRLNSNLILLVNDTIHHSPELFILEQTISVYKYSADKYLETYNRLKSDNSFNKYTSIRFWILYDYVRKYNIDRFYHAELDNVIFNVSKLHIALDKIGKGIFCPRDGIERALASFMYINDTNVLNKFINSYDSNTKNDMHALAQFIERQPDVAYSLPTESFHQNRQKWQLIHPDFTGGLFDAASIGQYLFGIDPKNIRYRPSRNLFINENSEIGDIAPIFFAENKQMSVLIRNKKYHIFNIHIHSKNMRNVFDAMYNNRINSIIRDANNGNSTIVDNEKYIYLEPIMLLFYSIYKKIYKINESFNKLFKS